MGTTFATFQSSGTDSCCNDLLNSLQLEGVIFVAVFFKRLAGVSSDPVALLISREFSKVSTSSSVKVSSVKSGSTVVFRYFSGRSSDVKYGGEKGIKKVGYFSRVCCNCSVIDV